MLDPLTNPNSSPASYPRIRPTTARPSMPSARGGVVGVPTLAPVVIDLEELSIHIAHLVAAQLAELLPATSPWMDVEHAAEYLSCSPYRVRKLVERRAIPFHQD